MQPEPKLVHFCPGCEAWQLDVEPAGMTGLSPFQLNRLLYCIGEAQADHVRECPPAQTYWREHEPAMAARLLGASDAA